MNLKRYLLLILTYGLTAACGGDDDSVSDNVNGTSSPSEETVSWTTVSYTWVSAWEPCTNNRLTINRNKQITSDRCGKVKTATISDADFNALQTQVNPALQNFNATLACTNEAIMDWAVYTYITIGDETKKMYSFDSDKNCARGPRAVVEQLQESLDALHDKYVPTDNSGVGFTAE